ncbi:Protein SUPPRESSOR OF NIM1 1 [Cardamine amara subsp. amara]|uniref:Protein SUPPRESSOR OF NIM1 1 n=1 Tax=Cardamine amara subsp. amara TaxID=228776 RepID=A0ABD0Z1B6_CARAN
MMSKNKKFKAELKTVEDLMALPVKLPWELEEDILSRLPPQSLVRFRTLCKKWNSLFTDKSFLNNHLSHSRPQFVFLTNSKIYSIDIINHNSNDPTIELHELPSSDIPNWDTLMNFTTIITCDDLLFYNFRSWENNTALWNPWLRQVRWMEFEINHFFVFGLGYDNSRPEKVYKILGYFPSHRKVPREEDQRVVVYDCASHTLRVIDKPKEYWPITNIAKKSIVSLNGNLYWFACNFETHEFFIRIFDFSRESFKTFCPLPCKKNYHIDEIHLAVFKGDRFSLLKQSCLTREVGIWVTKNRISNNNGDDGESVKWIKLMTLPKSYLPNLYCKFDRMSYFIYERTLFMCSGDDETGVACIYIVREDMCKKIQIGFGIRKCCHCVYTPNLISLP